jgi:cyanate permease
MAFNGASVGGVIFAPLWTMLIAAFGLPAAALILGGAAICIVCPLVGLFLRHEPPAAARHQAAPMARIELLRQGRFVTVSLAFALGLFAQIGLFAHLLARLGPEFGPSLAAAAISLVTLCAVLGRTGMAWLLGERDRRLMAAANLAMQAAGSLCLAWGDGMAVLAAGCVLFGLGVGNLTSLPPLIAQREFRPADVGTVVALVTAINQAIFAFAPAVFGWLHDRTANYLAAFLLAAAAQLLGAAIVAAGRRFS